MIGVRDFLCLGAPPPPPLLRHHLKVTHRAPLVHVQAIHEKYAGDKNLVKVEGDHNSPRPRFLFNSAAIFLQTYLSLSPEQALEGVSTAGATAALTEAPRRQGRSWFCAAPLTCCGALIQVDSYNNGYPPWVAGSVYAMRANMGYDEEGFDDDDDDDNDEGFGGYGDGDLNDGQHLGMTSDRQVTWGLCCC